jgi:replicative superfamily II helicase
LDAGAEALPRKATKYAYARDVQSEVWDRWYARRHEDDLVIKMNTGGGKTIVGLIALKSCLNESVGSAAYFTPDHALAGQVRGGGCARRRRHRRAERF